MSLSYKQKPAGIESQQSQQAIILSPNKRLSNAKNIDLGSSPFQSKLVPQIESHRSGGGDLELVNQFVNRGTSDFQPYFAQNFINLDNLNEQEANKILLALNSKMFNESISCLEDSVIYKSDKKQNHQAIESFLEEKMNYQYGQKIKSGSDYLMNVPERSNSHIKYIDQQIGVHDYNYGYRQQSSSQKKQNGYSLQQYEQRTHKLKEQLQQIDKIKDKVYQESPYSSQLANIINQKEYLESDQQHLNSKDLKSQTDFIRDEQMVTAINQQVILNMQVNSNNIDTHEDLDENVCVNIQNFVKDLKMKPAYQKHQLLFTADQGGIQPSSQKEKKLSNQSSSTAHVRRDRGQQQELSFQNHQHNNIVFKITDVNNQEDNNQLLNQSRQNSTLNNAKDMISSTINKQSDIINQRKSEEICEIKHNLEDQSQKQVCVIQTEIAKSKSNNSSEQFKKETVSQNHQLGIMFNDSQENKLNQMQNIVRDQIIPTKDHTLEGQYSYTAFQLCKNKSNSIPSLDLSNKIVLDYPNKANEINCQKIIQDANYQKCHLLKMESHMSEIASQKDMPLTQTSTEPDNYSFINSTQRDLNTSHQRMKECNFYQNNQYTPQYQNHCLYSEIQMKDTASIPNQDNLTNQYSNNSIREQLNQNQRTSFEVQNKQSLTQSPTIQLHQSIKKINEDQEQQTIIPNDSPQNLIMNLENEHSTENNKLDQNSEDKLSISKYFQKLEKETRNNQSLEKSSKQSNKQNRSNTNNSRNVTNQNLNQTYNTPISNYKNTHYAAGSTVNSIQDTRIQTEQFSDLLKKIKSKANPRDQQQRSLSPINKLVNSSSMTNPKRNISSIKQSQQQVQDKSNIKSNIFYSKRCSLTDQVLYKNQYQYQNSSNANVSQDKDIGIQSEIRRQTFQPGDKLPLQRMNSQINRKQSKQSSQQFLSPKQNSIQISIHDIENFPLGTLKNNKSQNHFSSQSSCYQSSLKSTNKKSNDETKQSTLLKLNLSQSPCSSSRLKSQCSEFDQGTEVTRTNMNKENTFVKQGTPSIRQPSIKNSANILKQSKIGQTRTNTEKITTQTLKQILKDSTIKQAQLPNFRSFSKMM